MIEYEILRNDTSGLQLNRLDDCKAKLNAMGAEGWDLVAVIPNGHKLSQYFYIFRKYEPVEAESTGFNLDWIQERFDELQKELSEQTIVTDADVQRIVDAVKPTRSRKPKDAV